MRQNIDAAPKEAVLFARVFDYSSKLSRWDTAPSSAAGRRCE